MSTLITIVLFLASHLGLAIWFASKISTQIRQMSDALESMALELKALAAMDTRVAVLEERTARCELDIRDSLKAATLLNRKMD